MYEKRSKLKAFWLNDDHYGLSLAEWVGTVSAVFYILAIVGIGIAALVN